MLPDLFWKGLRETRLLEGGLHGLGLELDPRVRLRSLRRGDGGRVACDEPLEDLQPLRVDSVVVFDRENDLVLQQQLLRHEQVAAEEVLVVFFAHHVQLRRPARRLFFESPQATGDERVSEPGQR